MKKIITIPHPTLREEAKLVTKVDKKLKKFISEIEETLIKQIDPPGVGLAAPQVDKLLRVFSIRTGEISVLKSGDIETFINPKIIKTSKDLSLGPNKKDPIMEACLSMPGLYGPVPRYSWIEVEYQYLDGEKLTEKKAKFENFEARVFQHELDHLDGILFTDHSLKYDLPVYKEVKKNKFEEVDPSLLELF